MHRTWWLLPFAALLLFPTAASANPPSAPTTDPSAGLQRAQAVADLAAYLEGIEREHAFEGWLASTDAFLRSLAPRPRVPFVPEGSTTSTTGVPAGAGSTTVTGACGGATNGADQFIQRESGGNPNALNPSGAWGCYQIMPGTWAGAGCNELGSYGSATPAQQAACASRLSLSAWGG